LSAAETKPDDASVSAHMEKHNLLCARRRGRLWFGIGRSVHLRQCCYARTEFPANVRRRAFRLILDGVVGVGCGYGFVFISAMGENNRAATPRRYQYTDDWCPCELRSVGCRSIQLSHDQTLAPGAFSAGASYTHRAFLRASCHSCWELLSSRLLSLDSKYRSISEVTATESDHQAERAITTPYTRRASTRGVLDEVKESTRLRSANDHDHNSNPIPLAPLPLTA